MIVGDMDAVAKRFEPALRHLADVQSTSDRRLVKLNWPRDVRASRDDLAIVVAVLERVEVGEVLGCQHRFSWHVGQLLAESSEPLELSPGHTSAARRPVVPTSLSKFLVLSHVDSHGGL